MAGERLHEYDLELCGYVLGNILRYCDEPRFAHWVQRRLGPPALLRYLMAGVRDPWREPERLLLGDDELHNLAWAATGGPNEQSFAWVPHVPLHRRYRLTVKEVGDALSRQVAEDWSRDCARFGRQLEGPRVYLAEGIEVVEQWLWSLRQLLRALGATDLLPCPEGRSPTPTCPAPLASPVPPATRELSSFEMAVERLRQAIKDHKDGEQANAKALINKARINNQAGRDALRYLSKRGEYLGFARERPARYRQGRPNER